MEVRINAMQINVPEGFRVLNSEERAGMQFMEEGAGEVLQDAERHIMISAAWKKHGRLANLLAGTADAAKAMEQKISAAMKPYGYVQEGFFREEAGGEPAEAFAYCYTVQDTQMSGESLILKRDGIHYYIHCYYRTERKEESLAVFRNLLRAVTWERKNIEGVHSDAGVSDRNQRTART